MSFEFASDHAKGDSPPSAAAIANHLASRCEFILEAWKTALKTDSELTTTEAEFLDNIPQALLNFGRVLCGEARIAYFHAGASDGESKDNSCSGCNLSEVILAWGHLHRCILHELALLSGAQPGPNANSVVTAQNLLAGFVTAAISDGARRCTHLRRAERVTQSSSLESELENARAIILQRASTLREWVHDLRGQLNIMLSATDFIADSTVDEAMRAKSCGILERAVRTAGDMLAGLVDEAQLNADQEWRS